MLNRSLGVVFSILIPGFGLLRAGLPKRAVAWFLSLSILSTLTAVALALGAIPLWFAAALFLVMLIAHIWMLFDSFKTGKMTPKLWGLFIVLFVTFMVLPDPVLLAIHSFEISTGAMAPTFIGKASGQTPDRLIVDKLSYRFSSPKRGDLLVFNAPEVPGIQQVHGYQQDVFYVKRLVGLPGEKITISDGQVFPNDQRLSEEDGMPENISYEVPHSFSNSERRNKFEYTVKPGEYFVLGDNTTNSFDSRYWGGVPKASILGKVSAIYYPFSRAGRIAN